MMTAFRRFVVLAGMRTGSNYLERLLSQFPKLVCHGELFNPGFIGKKNRASFLGIDLAARERDPERLLRAIEDDAEGRIPGFRLFDGHDGRVLKLVLDDPATAKVLLRRDPLHSFVSLMIARATDQWMLGNAAKRKTARVHFDPDAYRSFRRARDAFEQRILLRLQETGQAPFVLQYTDLKSPAIINGLARFLGESEALGEFSDPIKRQNPEPLVEKVENYEEMRDFLAAEAISDEEPLSPPPRGPGVPALITACQKPILFAPIPGVPNGGVLKWLESLGGYEQGHNRKALNTWLDENAEHFAFSIVLHPLERAWMAFTKRIVATGPGSYPKIRRRLVNHYGLSLPDDPTQWPVAERGAAFEAFLQFLKSNIAGQTGVRVDPDWAPQSDFISAMSSAVHFGSILRSEEAATTLARLAPEVSGPANDAVAPELAAIYSKRMENLARGAYPHDYRKFGFPDWSPSHT